MKVSEFIEFLKTQDQESIVRVITTSAGWSCGEPYTSVCEEEFNSVDHVTIEDWTTNSLVEPTRSWYMKKYITLGKRE